MNATFVSDLFAGRTILIVGGTSGIGLACARAFRDFGGLVTATGANERECKAAAAIGATDKIAFRVLDVRDRAAITDTVGALQSLDVLVNAAGVIMRDDEHDPDIFANVVEINLTGAMRVSSAAHRKLAAATGSVVNLASMLTFFGGPRTPGYSASKGGVGQLTKSLAAAWAKDGIRVNAVAPGWIATPLTQPLQDDAERSGPILSRTPMGRWGKPEEVADAVVFLASPAARFITGAILAVDGGYLTM
jgi:NAD(P)-dependent dehydrogenase (short-subunit alcohol dehydrogenase family)